MYTRVCIYCVRTTMHQRRRLISVVLVFVVVQSFSRPHESLVETPSPRVVGPRTAPRYVVAMSSFRRNDKPIIRSINSILKELDESVPIHVWGYLPTRSTSSRIHLHDVPNTSYHMALDTLPDEDLPHWVDDGQTHRGIYDKTTRVRWRSRIVLDAWAILTTIHRVYPTSHILWIENDAVLRHGFERRLEFPTPDDFLSCYTPTSRDTVYRGNGAVCLVFGPRYDFSLLLGYHLVEPFDWILQRGSTQPVRAYRGAFHPRDHKTTRTLD